MTAEETAFSAVMEFKKWKLFLKSELRSAQKNQQYHVLFSELVRDWWGEAEE